VSPLPVEDMFTGGGDFVFYMGIGVEKGGEVWYNKKDYKPYHRTNLKKLVQLKKGI
jgi:hypothetical protein